MAEVKTTKTKKTKRRVGTNPWVEHVKSEASRLGISYACAIPEAAKTYKKGQPAETKAPAKIKTKNIEVNDEMEIYKKQKPPKPENMTKEDYDLLLMRKGFNIYK